MTRAFGREVPAIAASAAPYAHGYESDPVLDLAGHGPYGLVLDLASASGTAAPALAQLAAVVLVAAAGPDVLLRGSVVPGEQQARIEAWLARPDHLPLTDGSVEIAVWHIAAEHLHACRPGFDELARVLVPGGTLIVAGVSAIGGQENGHTATNARSTASICRVIEEHGFVVDTAITTRPAAPAPRRTSLPATEEPDPLRRMPRVSCEPARARDVDLLRFAWPLTVVRSRKPGWRRFADP